MEELEFTAYQQRLEQLLKLQVKGRAKQHAACAIMHIRRAWALRAIDKEMAVFRALTAEEESATALMFSFKRSRVDEGKRVNYDGADRLRPRDHKHKWAVSFFLEAIGDMIDKYIPYQELKPLVSIDKVHGEDRVSIKFKIPGTDLSAHVDPPLNGRIDMHGTIVELGPFMAEVAKRYNKGSVAKHIEEAANFRNLLLYAEDRDYRTISNSVENRIIRHANAVFNHIAVLLMLDPYDSIQQFAQHALLELVNVVNPPKDVDPACFI